MLAATNTLLNDLLGAKLFGYCNKLCQLHEASCGMTDASKLYCLLTGPWPYCLPVLPAQGASPVLVSLHSTQRCHHLVDLKQQENHDNKQR
jgi:hypothetical protein